MQNSKLEMIFSERFQKFVLTEKVEGHFEKAFLGSFEKEKFQLSFFEVLDFFFLFFSFFFFLVFLFVTSK